MVQGLGFLSKKSWHTKNLNNQEKVWMAEQKKLAEEQKTKELAKQIQQEREQEELDKIAGKKSTTIDRGIDWMYQHTAGASELAKEDEVKKQEEFLLGKEFVPDGAAAGDFDNGDQTQGIHNVMAQQQTEQQEEQHQEATTQGHYEPSVKDRNESFRMRMEDPMFAVSKQRHDILQKHEHTKELYDKVGGPVTLMRKGEEEESRAEKKDRKRRHKDDDRRHRKKSDRKKHKKSSRRRRRRSRSRSPSTGSESGSDGYRRDRYDDDHHRHGRRDKDDEYYRRRDDRRRSRSRSRGRDHRRDNHRDRGSSNRRRDTYEDDSPSRRHDRRDYDRRRSYRSDDEDDGYNRRGHSREEGDDRKHSSQRRSSSEYNSKPPPSSSSNGDQPAKDSGRRPPEDSKYGLQGAKRKQLSSSDLGPNQDLLRQRRQQKEAERQRIKEMSSTRRRRTGDERAQAIQEMQQDAVRKEERARMVSNNRSKYNHDEEDRSRGKGATFITEMTKATHGIGDNSVSLSERLRQNRHTNQRSHDSFM